VTNQQLDAIETAPRDSSTTYKNRRNPEARREYMRNYMKRRRERDANRAERLNDRAAGSTS
jgi:hypothetical protein